MGVGYMNSGDMIPPQVNKTLLKHIVRDSESYIEDQLKCALAADQRAIQVSGFLVATIIALTAGAYTLLRTEPNVLGYALLILVAALCCSLACALHSTAPVSFNYRGSTPSDWTADIANKKPLVECLSEQLIHYQEMITENSSTLKRNAKLAKWAYRLIQISIFSALFVYFITLMERDLSTIWDAIRPYICNHKPA